MAELILIGVILLIVGLNNASINNKLDNYDTSKIDNAKLTHDAVSGVSVMERRRRCVNGYYDKK